VIVLSQACDITQRKKADGSFELETVVVAPLLSQAELQLNNEKWASVRKGRTYGLYHLLAYAGATRDLELAECAAAFRFLYTLPRAWLEKLRDVGERRLAVAPLYREHLSMWFALSYMRIGLPEEDDAVQPATASDQSR
jgi:hypothetical protein